MALMGAGEMKGSCTVFIFPPEMAAALDAGVIAPFASGHVPVSMEVSFSDDGARMTTTIVWAKKTQGQQEADVPPLAFALPVPMSARAKSQILPPGHGKKCSYAGYRDAEHDADYRSHGRDTAVVFFCEGHRCKGENCKKTGAICKMRNRKKLCSACDGSKNKGKRTIVQVLDDESSLHIKSEEESEDLGAPPPAKRTRREGKV